VTIRRTLLVAFLLVGLTPSVILTYLAFVQTRDALQREIETSLEAQAATVSADVNHILFERLQNALSWNHLDVMQDIRVNDVDKRLSQFLAEVKTAYGGLYRDLYCVDLKGRVIASSNAQLIGTSVPSPQSWLTASLPNGTAMLGLPQPTGGSDHLVLPIRAAILSADDDRPIGELVLLFDWQQIDQILDDVERSGRSAVLLDSDGRAIAASIDLRQQGLPQRTAPMNWRPPEDRGNGTVIRDGRPQYTGPVVIGFKHSLGFDHFSGLHWTTLVLQPSAAALASVHVMQLVFLGLLASTLLLTAMFSGLVAGRIARPIAQLTAFTRRFSLEHQLPPAPPVTRGEVGELTEAFVKTVQDLDRSRQDFFRASKLAVAGEIAATMAHEIRTPLGILRSSAQVLLQEPGISAEGRELVGFIESETERINRLVSSVLDSANPRPPQLALHDMGAIAHACVVMLGPQARKRAVLIEDITGTGDLSIQCDVEQLTQVVLNLLLNAVQLLPPQGRVAVECREESNEVWIEVGDNGPGIPEADRLLVFEPFVSKRSGGLGLGLAVVKQIVVAHHGEIRIGESRCGGALFSIRFPRDTNS